MLISARGAFLASERLTYDAEVEYLESTGTQWIDTQYIPNNNTYVELNAMYTALDSVYRVPFSVRTRDGATDTFTISASSAAENTYSFGSSYWSRDGRCPIPSINTRYFMSLKSSVANFNGTIGYAGVSITPSGLTAYLFARNSNGLASNFFKGRIYSCKIYDTNSALVRDFIPVRFTNELGNPEGAMYDKVSGELFRNRGTGAFIVGPDVSTSNKGGGGSIS